MARSAVSDLTKRLYCLENFYGISYGQPVSALDHEGVLTIDTNPPPGFTPCATNLLNAECGVRPAECCRGGDRADVANRHTPTHPRRSVVQTGGLQIAAGGISFLYVEALPARGAR
jgi:hypothetical protein